MVRKGVSSNLTVVSIDFGTPPERCLGLFFVVLVMEHRSSTEPGKGGCNLEKEAL